MDSGTTDSGDVKPGFEFKGKVYGISNPFGNKDTEEGNDGN